MTTGVHKPGELVPFGKYRGQPVEVMLSDFNYCEWLMSQDWFKQRFQPIYNVIIQGVPESQDSPEHNAMQAKFLDDGYRSRFLDLLGKSAPFPVSVNFEVWREQVDVTLDMDSGVVDGGAFSDDIWVWGFIVAIEIKPTIGDDFPTILRQTKTKIDSQERWRENLRAEGKMLRPVAWAVAYERFTAATVTVEQVAAMFAPIKLVCVAGL